MTAEIVQVNTILLQSHPKHSFFHSHFSSQPELYEFIKRDVEEHGIQSPLLVQVGTNVIMDGHMRHSIALDLKIETVPVVYRDVDEERAELALVEENRKRQQGERDPIRLARQVAVLKKEYGLRNGEHRSEGESGKLVMADLANELGFKARQLYKYLRLMHLVYDFQRLVSTGLLGIKAAVSISYLPFEDQQVLYQVAMSSGTPKNALSETIVTEWIAEYRKNQESLDANKFTRNDRMIDSIDRALDHIDQQYDIEQVVGTDKLLRHSILTMASALSEETGSNFEKAVIERNVQKQIRTLKRLEQRLMAMMIPEANPDPLLLREIERILTRLKQKLDEVRSVLNDNS